MTTGITQKEACIHVWVIIAEFHAKEISNSEEGGVRPLFKWIEERCSTGILDEVTYKESALFFIPVSNEIKKELENQSFCFACLEAQGKEGYESGNCRASCPATRGDTHIEGGLCAPSVPTPAQHTLHGVIVRPPLKPSKLPTTWCI
jgi:hypothetical protein